MLEPWLNQANPSLYVICLNIGDREAQSYTTYLFLGLFPHTFSHVRHAPLTLSSLQNFPETLLTLSLSPISVILPYFAGKVVLKIGGEKSMQKTPPAKEGRWTTLWPDFANCLVGNTDKFCSMSPNCWIIYRDDLSIRIFIRVIIFIVKDTMIWLRHINLNGHNDLNVILT